MRLRMMFCFSISSCSFDFWESSLYRRMLLSLDPRTLMGVLLPLGMMGNPYWSTSPEGEYLARPDTSSTSSSAMMELVLRNRSKENVTNPTVQLKLTGKAAERDPIQVPC